MRSTCDRLYLLGPESKRHAWGWTGHAAVGGGGLLLPAGRGRAARGLWHRGDIRVFVYVLFVCLCVLCEYTQVIIIIIIIIICCLSKRKNKRENCCS